MYNVVFEYTKEVKECVGVRTYTSFKDKTDFEKWYSDNLKKRLNVIEEGINDERVKELIKATSTTADFNYALNQSINPETKKINIKRLEFELENSNLSRLLDN